MTDTDDREFLRNQLDELQKAETLIQEQINPLVQAQWPIQAARDALLDRFGTDIAGTCESCSATLLLGDKGCDCGESIVMCEACAPTYGDLKHDYEAMSTDDFINPDFPEDQDGEANKAAALARIQNHIDNGGSLDDKAVKTLNF